MEDLLPTTLNVLGVENLVSTNTNKILNGISADEGVSGDEIDLLELDMTDEELRTLRRGYESKSAPYTGKVESRQKANKAYLFGTQMNQANGKTVPSNLLFQATATFVPQALAKNPEPVVWSDNTEEGKLASNDIKTMLQFHADQLELRKKLGTMVWHWSVYFTAILKYGWNSEINDISIQVRNPKNFVLDPDGYIDDAGDYKGEYLGERIQSTAEELIKLYPKSKEYITDKVGMKLGTMVTRTEWWSDKFCFTTFEEEILDKHKNEFFNYEEDKPNHFAVPKMPYTFLSVFSLQEQPHDFTNNIEQNLANQDSIIETEIQVMKNLRHGNNAIAASTEGFNAETGKEGMQALENGDWVLVNGDVSKNIMRIPANPLPNGLLEKLEVSKQTLQGIYGTQGVTAQPAAEDTTARGMILNQSFDNTRIGGGVGDSLETVAKSAFNFMLQLYYVFYDEKHYAAIMGNGRAVEYVALTMANEQRRFVVSVIPNSMAPKDETTEQNLATQRWGEKAIDPIGLMKAYNDPDPIASAKALVLWTVNPQQYMATYFPDLQQPQQQAPGQPPPPEGGNDAQPEGASTLSSEPANSQLSTVPLNS